MTKRAFLSALFISLAAAAAAQTPPTIPATPTSVVVMVMPSTGDVATLAPIAVRETSISKTGTECALPHSTLSLTDPVVNPTTVFFDDPFTPFADCKVPLPTGVAPGSYRVVAYFKAPSCDVNGAPVTPCVGPQGLSLNYMQVSSGNPCDPDTLGRKPVDLAVGDWTRTSAPATVGRVLFSLTQSTQPVTEVVVRLDGVVQDNLTGSDLRKVAGSYFQLPLRKASYSLSVEAKTAAGCSDGATRPMTVVVQ